MAMAATIPPGGVFELICSKSENLRPCREDPSDGRKTCLFDMPRLPNQLEPPFSDAVSVRRCLAYRFLIANGSSVQRRYERLAALFARCPPLCVRRGSGRPVDNDQVSHGTVQPQRHHFLVRG